VSNGANATDKPSAEVEINLRSGDAHQSAATAASDAGTVAATADFQRLASDVASICSF